VTNARPTILLVEDDRELGEALRAFFDVSGFDLLWFRSGPPALEWLTRQRADLCVLDVMLPRANGFEIATSLRRAHPELPFVFLTARALKPDRLRGFGVGADDYIVKPVDEDELLARVRVVLRRARTTAISPDVPMPIGRYVFDHAALTLRLGHDRRMLTEREAALLALLCARIGQLVRREEVLHTLWKRDDIFARRSMNVFVHRLRGYLRRDPAVSITTVRNVGVMLEVGAAILEGPKY
jgi:DNA-binding response OmpR family regulator